MFNSVQLVRDLCKTRNIPIAKLEKDCGFSNGYLNPKKMSKIPYDRAVVIAEYLRVSVDLILTGEENKKAPTGNGERDILDEIDVAFYGDYKELSEDDKETLRAMARVMKERRAKKDQEN
ncbi:MAG: hypothetical protein IJO04_05225 [Oscillospiraceae bacterium]|nr:hypothetical protein [Oscillospiraceae bacterium]